MRIGIGAIVGVLGGPATYARELTCALGRIDSVNEYVVITDAPERLGVSAPNVRCVRAPLGSPLLQPAWDHAWVPFFVRRAGIDLYHGTKGVLPVWAGCPAVVTIHDLAVYHQPETFAWLQRVHLRAHTPLAIRRAVRVIADSEDARRDIVDRFHVHPSRLAVVPLAAAPRFSASAAGDDELIAQRLHLPARFVLYAGTIQPRKNVETLVAAFASLSQRNATTELLVAGRLRPGYQPGFLKRLPPYVRYLGPVSDAELAVLYRRALALCSPSSYEGFGLSLLEAMSSGCVVVAGRNSSVPELVDGCGILLSELTVPALHDALLQVINDPASLGALRQRALERAARYSWDETARRTLAVYREAMDDVRSAA